MYRLLLVGLFAFELVVTEREHKVHNIVLYPEKHSWCQITPIQQIVASPGYDPVTIDNNVCVGACYSYSIPKTQPAEPGELIGPYCDSCQPSEIKCYHVNLHPDEKNLDLPKVLQKRVQIITNCSCQSCDKIRKDDCEITDENTLELPRDLFTDDKNGNKLHEEIPELLERNSTNSIPEDSENDIKFKNKLKKWFEVYQNDSEQVRNDDEYYFQKYNSPAYQTFSSEHNQRKVQDNFEIESMPSRHKGAHHIGISHSQNDVVEDLEKKPSNGHHLHHHKHHLGDEQHIGMNVVHLVKGPHGSMVAGPVEAKLHIDSDALTPNSEGVIIDYENHHHKNIDSVLEN